MLYVDLLFYAACGLIFLLNGVGIGFDFVCLVFLLLFFFSYC